MNKKFIQFKGPTTPVDSEGSLVSDHQNFREAAKYWFEFGFNVIPILPNKKVTATQWNPWLDQLSLEKIDKHWLDHPKHEIGLIVDDSFAVFDADSPQSIDALNQIEMAFDLTSNLIVKTRKGQHHYFRLAPSSFIKTDSHSTEAYPERIDVKARRSMVILPPSTGKEVLINEANNVNELSMIGQDFIDAVFRHNGRNAPQKSVAALITVTPANLSSLNMSNIEAMLAVLNPDCGREDWIHVGMAIHFESSGSNEGFTIWNAWSSKGKKYPGEQSLRTQWHSFRIDDGQHFSVGTIKKMVSDAGYDWMDICAGSPFEMLISTTDSKQNTTEVNEAVPLAISEKPIPLDQYSLTGRSTEVEKMTVEATPLLGNIALTGQATIIYAAPNTGKTLITIWLIIEAVKNGRIEPSKLYYLNMDDTGNGLLDKLLLAEEYGFHMLAEGYRDFKIVDFMSILDDLIDTDRCKGIIIILDTLKKFTNLMDKQKASSFTKVIRRFIVKGGTLIALAHTNKNPGANGKLVYGGTTDIIDDSDCAYILTPVSITEDGSKVVEFENIKCRGNVAKTAAYSYTTGTYNSYAELLLTVSEFDSKKIDTLKQEEELKTDAEIINVVIECITSGINTKMRLAEETAARAGVSKRNALSIIEKYCGADLSVHRWDFIVKDRGAKVFSVHPKI